MEPVEAFDFLVQITGDIPLTRAGHERVTKALMILKECVMVAVSQQRNKDDAAGEN